METFTKDQGNQIALTSLAYLANLRNDYLWHSLEISGEISQELGYKLQFVEAYRRLNEISFMFADAPSLKNKERLDQAYAEVVGIYHRMQAFLAEKNRL